MKRLLFLLPFLLLANEDFISHYEYGEMLYDQPRGVSCAECHGESGEGRIIVEFRDIHGKKILRGPDIRKETLTSMINSVNSYHKIMPRYYLTDEEVKAIYDYLQEKNTVYLCQSAEGNTSNTE
jgi:mono/diheme cytochrome c family protein